MIFIPLLIPLAAVYFFVLNSHIWTTDAGELAVASHFLKLAHPPGYPLYIILSRIVHFLLPSASLAYALSIVSLISSLAALYFIYKILELAGFTFFKDKKLRFLAILGVYALGTIPLWWLYSVVQEVFMTTIFFMTSSTYFLLSGVISKKNKHIIIGILLFSFGVFHQYLILALIPSFVYLFWSYKVSLKNTFKPLWLIILCLVAGFVPYLIFLGQYNDTVPLLWIPVKSVLDLFYYAFRLNYGFLSLFSSGTIPLAMRIQTLYQYVIEITRSFNVLSILFIIVGIGSIFTRKSRRLEFFFLLQLFCIGPLFFFLYPISLANPFYKAIFERFVLLSFPALFFFFWRGIETGLIVIKKLHKSLQQFVTISILILLITFQLLKYFPLFATLAKDNSIERFAQSILDYVPKNSIFIANQDIVLFPVQYEYFVKGTRKDLLVIAVPQIENKILFERNQDILKKYRIATTNLEGKKRMYTFISENSKTRHVVTNFDIVDIPGIIQEGPVYYYKEKPLKITLKQKKDFLFTIPKILTDSSFSLYGLQELNRYFKKTANFYATDFFNKKDYKNSLYFLKESNAYVADRDTQFSIGAASYKLGDCDGTKEAWKEGFLLYADPEFARRMSQVSAVCDKDLKEANFWNFMYVNSRKGLYK